MEEIAEEYAEKSKICKLNTDDARDSAMEFGISAIPTYPNLAGQKEAYMVKQMKAFKDGTRKDPTMNAMAKPLSDADMANIAAHYAGMK